MLGTEKMNELAITQVWMAGVVGMMLVFGVTALFGYVKKYRITQRNNTEK